MPTKLITKHSTVVGAVPSASDLEVAELAVNVTDKKLYTKDTSERIIKLIGTETFKPSAYGAVGDGSTDDITAIKAMIVDVKANGGGTVDLEEKKYAVSETVAFGVPIRLLCGKGAGFKAKNSISTFTEITNRAGNVQPNEDGSGNYRVLFDIDGMAYSSFEGLFELSSVGGTSAMGGQVNYVHNLIAMTQQDGTGPVQALNGYFENLYVTKLHAAFFQPFKTIGTGPVLPYTRTWFARLEIIKCYQAWNFQHVNGFDDCAVGVLRVNKCAEDAYAKAFDLNCVEAFFAGGKATEDATFSTTADSNAFTTSTTGVVAVGDRVLVKGAETYGQGFCTKIATYSGTSGTFEDVCPVTTTNAEFIFGAGGFLMDRGTLVCNKLYLEGAFQKLLHFTRQATLEAQTLKFSTGEFGCYKGRPIVFEHINSVCNIGSVPQSEQGVNGNPLIESGLGKLIQSYVYYGLRKFTDIQIPPPDPDTGLPLPTPENTFDFYPEHKGTVSLMMDKTSVDGYGINPIEVGHTIYDTAGFAGGIREWSTSNSQLIVNYSDATVKVSGDIGGNALVISGETSVIPLSAFGGSPAATATVNTAAMEKAWLQLKNKGGKILLDEAGDWNFNNSTFAHTTKPIEIEAVDGVEVFPASPSAATWMWDFLGSAGVTQVNFTNVRVSGQNEDNSRKEFLGIRVGRSNNLTAYKCFGRYVDGTAWHFIRPHNSEIDVTTFNSGKDNATHANRFALMITGAYEAGSIDQVFNDVRLSGTTEKDYYGWVVEGGTLLRTTSQLKIHGADYAHRGFQLHRVADFDVQLNMSQRYNDNGFVHFSDAPAATGGSSTDGVTLFVGQDTGSGGLSASLPIRGTAHLSNVTNSEIAATAPNATVDLFVLNISAASSAVECTGMLIPQVADDINAQTTSLTAGRQYRIGTVGTGDWNTYLSTSGVDYKVGDFFTAPSTGVPNLAGAVVTRRYGMIGLTGLSNKLNFPKLGKVAYTASVVDQLVRDSRSMTSDTNNNQKILQNDISPAIGGAVMEKLQTEGTAEPQTPTLEVTRLQCVRLSNTVVQMNRRGTLGKILELQRGNDQVGNIGVELSDPSDTNSQEVTYIESEYDGDTEEGVGLTFGVSALLPRKGGTVADKLVDLGSSDYAFKDLYLGDIKVVTGTGSPESVVTAPKGSLFLRTDGGDTTTFYVKTSGTGNTGWLAK